eukprot:SAG22_NODE_940_length_6402_cov_34.673172_2_plen_285_part_00
MSVAAPARRAAEQCAVCAQAARQDRQVSFPPASLCPPYPPAPPTRHLPASAAPAPVPPACPAPAPVCSAPLALQLALWHTDPAEQEHSIMNSYMAETFGRPCHRAVSSKHRAAQPSSLSCAGSSSSGATPTSARVRTSISSRLSSCISSSHSSFRNSPRSCGPHSATGRPSSAATAPPGPCPPSKCAGVLVVAQSVQQSSRSISQPPTPARRLSALRVSVIVSQFLGFRVPAAGPRRGNVGQAEQLSRSAQVVRSVPPRSSSRRDALNHITHRTSTRHSALASA